MTHNRLSRLITQSTAALTLIGAANAGTVSNQVAGKAPQQTVEAKEESPFDKIWSLFSLYKNESNPFIEELAITGRYHGQYHYEDNDSTSNDDWDNRRFRLGLEATMLDKKLKLKGEIFSDLNAGGDFYEGFTELYAAWKFSDALTLTVGKQKPRFSNEWSTSSRLIKTFERSTFINQFKPDYAPGISLSGKSGKLSYFVGGFSDQVDGEFGQFDGGFSIVANVAYDVADIIGTEKATARIDYIHSERDDLDTIFTAFDNGVAASLELKDGAFGLSTEVLAGFGASNNFGWTLTPSYNLTKNLQIVGRYSLGFSDDDSGISPQKRYEGAIGAGKGDVYNAFYGGLTYFFYEDKLKLMTGVEYSTMSGGNDTLTFLAGIRAYW